MNRIEQTITLVDSLKKKKLKTEQLSPNKIKFHTFEPKSYEKKCIFKLNLKRKPTKKKKKNQFNTQLVQNGLKGDQT